MNPRPVTVAERSVCMVAPRVYLIVSGDSSQRFAGGAEVQQAFIARGLVSRGYRVTVLTGDFGQPEEVVIEGVRFLKIRQSGRALPVLRFFHPRLTNLWRAMADADAAIYYQRGSGIGTFATAAFAAAKKRSFVFSSASDPDLDKPRTKDIFPGRGGWRELQLYHWGLRRADRIVAQHAGQAATCRRWHGREAEHIPSCYAPPDRPTSNSPNGVVLWVGMLRPMKRAEKFLALARRLPERKFRVIGGMSAAGNDPTKADYYKRIEREAAGLPNVEFLGFIPYHRVEEHFDEASLFVNTSDYEGFPNTFLQAWARGVPTVSFIDCGAADASGSVGFVAADDDELLATVSLLTSDHGRWHQEGQRSRSYFEATHSLDAVADRYAALFDGLPLERHRE